MKGIITAALVVRAVAGVGVTIAGALVLQAPPNNTSIENKVIKGRTKIIDVLGIFSFSLKIETQNYEVQILAPAVRRDTLKPPPWLSRF